MKAKLVSVFLLVLILVCSFGSAIQENVDVHINMSIDVVNNSRFVTMYYPGSSFPDRQGFGDVCTTSVSRSIDLVFRYPYNFECNMTSIQNDFTTNITYLINLTGYTNSLIIDKLDQCDKIKEANMEMSIKLQDYKNRTSMADQADSYRNQLESCQTAASTCQTERQTANDELKKTKDQQLWIFLFGAAAGAVLVYITKVRKDLPRTPVEDQFNLRG